MLNICDVSHTRKYTRLFDFRDLLQPIVNKDILILTMKFWFFDDIIVVV